MATPVQSKGATRVAQEKDRVARQTKQVTSRLTPLKIYLVAYNTVSALLWLNILVLTIGAVVNHPPATPIVTSKSPLSKIWGGSTLPSQFDTLSNALERLKGNYEVGHLGTWVKWTQTLALLEIAHSALGWVRSPVGTTGAQVASRIYTVWGVVEAIPKTQGHPLFTTMVFAWALTEVVRYTFYATSVLGVSIPGLNWLRYTTFLPLYPLGAGSEAFLSFSTLPSFSTFPVLGKFVSNFIPIRALISYIPASVGKSVMKSNWGRNFLWNMAASGVKSKAGLTREWEVQDLVRFTLFLGWWPALYVLYTYMLGQRRKVLGGGRTLKAKTA